MESETNGINRNEDGTFGKGNPGKPKGAVQKISVKVKESIFAFMENNIDSVQESYETLKPKEKLEFIASLMPYLVPKLSATQIEGELKAGLTIRFEDPGTYIYPAQDQSDNGIPESIQSGLPDNS